MNFRRLSCILLSAVLSVALFSAPENSKQDEERFVRLMSAQSVRILEKDGRTYRQAEGPARFLHNNTWLICDTALWDVDRQLIHAIGHVSLEQDRTELKSDSLNYFIERNTAEFRGALVQLQDKDGNMLRTRNLDYNTKDSIAVFRGGAAMRDKDGQIMESLYGTYDSKIKLFEFQDRVNMYTDSVFVKTSALKYDSNTSIATFPDFLDAWKDENMLSGQSGWWDRSKELFFFKGNVHATTDTQESWSDSLYFDRRRMNVDMLGHVQVTDTTRAVSALAGRIYYCDTVSRVEMFRDPVVLLEANEKDKDGVEKKDTVYCRADSIVYWTVPRNRVDSSSNAAAQARQKEISSDPVANIRAKAAEEEAKRRQEAIDNDPNADPTLKTEYKEKKKKEEAAAKASADSLDRAIEQERKALDRFLISETPETAADSLAVADSLQTAVDSLAVNDSLAVDVPEPDDSIKIGFLKAHGKVKVFRNTLQVACDSLLYNDIDSLARLFKDPTIWNDVKHQYNADSIYLAIHSSTVDKAYLLSNAFIHIDEQERDFFDQIKSTEMTAFFDGNGKLKRFDAMGGASAIFFMREKEKVSTANKKEAKILTAEFENDEIRKISYFEEPKSDVYPVAQMTREDKFLKGYKWKPDARPKSPSDLTSRVPRKSQRSLYAARPRATFTQTERFFKGYMSKIYREIERSDSLRRVKNTAPAVEDTTLAVTDTLVMDAVGTVAAQIPAEQPLDSVIAGFKVDLRNIDSPIILIPCPQIDSLIEQGRIKKARADSIAAIKTPAQLKKEAAIAAAAQRKAEAKARQEARIAAREARWDELDLRDSLKLAAKNARKHDNKDKKLRRKMNALLEQKAKEDALLEKYKQGYLKRFRRDGLPKDALKETEDSIAPDPAPQRREVHREDSSGD